MRSLTSLQFRTAADADGLSTFRGDIMGTGATPDLISQLLAQTFSELGATGSVVRMFLLCDREFVGQRFRCEKVQAVMLAGKDEIEFYDQAGELLKTVSLEETEKKSAA